MNARRLSIGLLAQDRLQQRTLRSLVEQGDYRLAGNFLLDDLARDQMLRRRISSMQADAWILVAGSNTNAESGWLEDDWLASLQGVVIVCDEPVPTAQAAGYASWQRRLNAKLSQLAGTVNLSEHPFATADSAWVLAASTGGPAAVKEFLAALPAALGIGFVYVQHIDAGYENTLARVFARDSHYPAYQVEHGAVLRPNALAIVPPDRATELLPNGTFVVSNQPWSGSHSPSIDGMLASVAQSYGQRSGVIVFTGMGEDGASSCRLLRRSGGRVWAQSLESCTVDAMPRAAVATGCVEFSGTPAALAQKLSEINNYKAKGSAPRTLGRRIVGASHE